MTLPASPSPSPSPIDREAFLREYDAIATPQAASRIGTGTALGGIAQNAAMMTLNAHPAVDIGLGLAASIGITRLAAGGTDKRLKELGEKYGLTGLKPKHHDRASTLSAIGQNAIGMAALPATVYASRKWLRPLGWNPGKVGNFMGFRQADDYVRNSTGKSIEETLPPGWVEYLNPGKRDILLAAGTTAGASLGTIPISRAMERRGYARHRERTIRRIDEHNAQLAGPAEKTSMVAMFSSIPLGFKYPAVRNGAISPLATFGKWAPTAMADAPFTTGQVWATGISAATGMPYHHALPYGVIGGTAGDMFLAGSGAAMGAAARKMFPTATSAGQAMTQGAQRVPYAAANVLDMVHPNAALATRAAAARVIPNGVGGAGVTAPLRRAAASIGNAVGAAKQGTLKAFENQYYTALNLKAGAGRMASEKFPRLTNWLARRNPMQDEWAQHLAQTGTKTSSAEMSEFYASVLQHAARRIA